MLNAPPRHDIYAGVHKGLRRQLAMLLIDLGRADWANAKECDRLRFAVARQLVISRQHLHHEDLFIRPLIEAAGPEASSKVDSDHHHHEASFATLTSLLERIALEPREARSLGHQLYMAFTQFIAEDLVHMAYEETVVMPLLHAHYSDADLEAVHQRLVASLAPEEFLESFRFIVPALSHDERLGLLSGMQADAPPEVFQMVLAAVRPALAEAEWTALDEGLTAFSRAA